MRRRTLFAFFVVLFCSAFQARGFSGCGGTNPPTGGVLPTSGEPSCFTDMDCTGDPCRMQACLAGRCVDRGMTDFDGDGASPMPCGMDCDDLNASRYPGAAELCDSVDQDCDGTIDEDATASPRYWSLVVEDPDPAIALIGPPSDPRVVVSDGRPMLMSLTRYEVDFSRSGELDVAHSSREDELVPMADGGARIVLLEPGALRIIPLTAAFTLGTATMVPTSMDAAGLVAVGYGAELALAWIEGGSTVHFWTSEMAGPMNIGPVSSSGALGLAVSGSTIVLAVPPNQALFLDPGTGMVVSMRALDAPLTWASAPLASGPGYAVGLVRDAFDHALLRLEPVGTLRTTPTPAVRDTSAAGRVDATTSQVLVTRYVASGFDAPGTVLAILEPGFVRPLEIDLRAGGAFGVPSGWDVAARDDIIVVASSFSGSVSMATLACGL